MVGLAMVVAAGTTAAWVYLHRDRAAGPAAGLHKCVQGAQVLYTDGACPAGSRPQAVTAGAVTVVPGPRAAARAASVPNVRELLAPQEETSMRDRMMDRAIDNIGK